MQNRRNFNPTQNNEINIQQNTLIPLAKPQTELMSRRGEEIPAVQRADAGSMGVRQDRLLARHRTQPQKQTRESVLAFELQIFNATTGDRHVPEMRRVGPL